MNVERIVEALKGLLPDVDLQPQAIPLDETFLTLPPRAIRPAVQLLIEQFGLRHLSTITGEDTGDEIVLLYHFWDGRGLTLRTTLPREGAHVATLTDLIPGAAFYEREVAEMLGVVFDGHADPRRLLLPDDWEGAPPLRREETATVGGVSDADLALESQFRAPESPPTAFCTANEAEGQ
jgi:NADH:ubiquinone oxidoreductase subunit C